MIDSIIVGAVTGITSAVATLAVVRNDIRWIKRDLRAIWTVIRGIQKQEA